MKKILRLLSALALNVCLIHTLAAQGRTVTGKVTAADDGSSLPGVNVIVKGSSNGTTTNTDGNYSLADVPANATLVFSFIGMTTQEVEVGNQGVVNVQLVSDVRELGEVVVVGYGTQDKREVTGSIARIKGDDIVLAPVQSFDQALQGRAAGVNITTPNGVLNNPPVIRIRGVNSINLSSFPLVVIDGVPTFTGDNSSNLAANNPLGNLNPADIESIEVLKDASASAIYGSRASAGVILITTKRGASGKARVNVDSWVGLMQPVRLIPLLNAEQYMDVKNEARRNNGQDDAFFPSIDANGNLIDTDWYKYVYRNGLAHSNNVSVSGGSDATKYFLSIGRTDQQGMLQANSFNRTSARMNLDHKLYNNFTIGTNIAFANTLNRSPSSGSVPGAAFSTSGLGRLPLITAPNVGPFNPDGTYNIDGALIGTMNNTQQSGFYNPVTTVELDRYTSEANSLQASVYANWEIIRGLNLRTTYGIDRLTLDDQTFLSSITGDGYADNGIVRNVNRTNRRWNWANTAQYDFMLGEQNSFSVLGGIEQQYTRIERWGADRRNVADPFFENFQGNYTNIQPWLPFYGENFLVSYFGRLNYDFGKKYFVSASVRRDGFSAFAPGRQFGNFYGASVGYALSQESFWQNSPLSSVVNFFKLRASYGIVGNNQGIDDYASLSLYGSGLYGEEPTIFFEQAGNPQLAWETSKKTDLGFNFGLFEDRITGEFAYYNNLVDGLILRVPQAPSRGIPNPTAAFQNTLLENVGVMRNRGIELNLQATAIRKANFTWTINANITTLKNEVTSLFGEDVEIQGQTSSLEAANVTRVGFPVGSLKVVPTAGVNPANGQRIFVKRDGTQVQYDHSAPTASRWTRVDDGGVTTPVSIVNDGVIIGPTLPTFYGGLDNTFKLGNFDLGIFLQFSGGNYIYNGTKAGLRDMRFWNNSTDVLNRWTEGNPNGTIPRVVYTDNVSNGSSFPISENVEKGDFVRLRNVSLGYSLNNSLIQRIGMSRARVYAQVQNALLLTNYTGFDPEISTNGNNNLAPGVDRNSIGQARTFTVGVNLDF
jgi:TonB-dependent starch-binding outer membrane protein SusC